RGTAVGDPLHPPAAGGAGLRRAPRGRDRLRVSGGCDPPRAVLLQYRNGDGTGRGGPGGGARKVRELGELVRAVAARHVPDARSAIFDVRLVRQGDDAAFIGETSVASAAAEFMARAQAVAPDRRVLV